jgi:cation diffusion facilitator CzcD-associated flavoprotein CzcO
MGIETTETVIVGAGFSGLCAGAELLRHGRTNFVILEKASAVGGTWRDNTYPGVECDVPSHLYSYSFALNPFWSKTYGTGAEINAYQEACVGRLGLGSHLRFGAHVDEARWTGTEWVVSTSGGDQFVGRYLIAAVGGLHTPNIPAFAGLADFAGPVFHTSAWDQRVDLTGKRVAVIGTGATAVQVAPEIARRARHLTVFQRSPIWVGPKRDTSYEPGQQEHFARDRFALRRHRWDLWRRWESVGADLVREGTDANRAAQRAAPQNLVDNVYDKRVAELLLPDYNVACKRPTFSQHYYPMFNRANVRLETAAITHFTRTGATLKDGRAVPLDVAILATGFKPFDISKQVMIYGIGALALADAWRERVTSYRSVMVHQFPNMFVVLGPNSAGLTSALQMIEAGAAFAARAIRRAERAGLPGFQPTSKAMDEFTGLVDRLSEASTMNRGCMSWWASDGVNHSMWPDSSVKFRQMLGNAAPSDFAVLC